MRFRNTLFAVMLGLFAVSSAFAQFTPRKDVVWARDISVLPSHAMTIDGKLTEPAWAKAESVAISYGTKDGLPGSGYKIMNGSGTPGDAANAVLKFLADKTTNMLYIAVIAKDSSVGGNGWENSDGILGGIYDRRQKAATGVTLHKDMFITMVDSSLPGTLFNLKGGDLPTRGVATVGASVLGTSNVDTTSGGAVAADTGWVIEIAVSLDSLGYNANSVTTDAVQMTMAIWDADWVHGGGTPIATKAWWANEWGNNGGGLAARVLVRSDVSVNTTTLPEYPYDVIVRNGSTFPDVTVDGSLSDSVWAHVPSFNIQFGDSAGRAAYPGIAPDRSGQYVTKGAAVPFNAGVAKVKMFFKGDKLYIGADVSDRSLNHYVGDDFFDGLQVSLNVPLDTLYDKNAHVMASRRIGIAVDSSAKHYQMLWDAQGDSVIIRALTAGLALKPGSTVDNNTDVDGGFTVELAVDLSKLGYPVGATNKVAAVGMAYHDYDLTATDTSAYRVWWFREWPWTSSPAFVLLDNNTLVTGIGDQAGPAVAGRFELVGNYPNPFNPSTRIQFMVPATGTAKLMVYDLLGRMVYENTSDVKAGMQERTFSAPNLASGVYYFRVEFVASNGGERHMSAAKAMLLLK